MNKKFLLLLCVAPILLMSHPMITSAATKVTSTSPISTMTSDSDGYNDDVNTGYVKTISVGNDSHGGIPGNIYWWPDFETLTNDGAILLPLAHSAYYDLSYCSSVSFYLCFRYHTKGNERSSLYLVDSKGKEIRLDDGYINWNRGTPDEDELDEVSSNIKYDAPASYKWQHSSSTGWPGSYRRYYSVNIQNYKNSLDLTNCRFEWRGWIRVDGYTQHDTHTYYVGVAIEELKANVHTHTWGNWVTVTDSTCTATGTKKRTCSTCGATETTTIPKKDHNYNLTTINDPRFVRGPCDESMIKPIWR